MNFLSRHDLLDVGLLDQTMFPLLVLYLFMFNCVIANLTQHTNKLLNLTRQIKIQTYFFDVLF